jgi:hypothetical protein
MVVQYEINPSETHPVIPHLSYTFDFGMNLPLNRYNLFLPVFSTEQWHFNGLQSRF